MLFSYGTNALANLLRPLQEHGMVVGILHSDIAPSSPHPRREVENDDHNVDNGHVSMQHLVQIVT